MVKILCAFYTTTMVQRHLLNQLLRAFISDARVDKKGAVAMLYYNEYQCKQLSEGKFNSFEHVALLCSPSMYEISPSQQTAAELKKELIRKHHINEDTCRVFIIHPHPSDDFSSC